MLIHLISCCTGCVVVLCAILCIPPLLSMIPPLLLSISFGVVWCGKLELFPFLIRTLYQRTVKLWNSLPFAIVACTNLSSFKNFQMATALLVAGSTPTFWIPQFVSTSSYCVVEALGCRRLTYGSFQLTHMSRDDTLFNWSSHGGQNEDRTLLQRSQRYHSRDHYDVARIFVGLSWELYYRTVRSSDGG